MNDYEKRRLENIKNNNEMLKSLGFEHVEMPLLDASKEINKKPAPLKKPPAKRVKVAIVEPTRVSRRRLGQAPDGSEKGKEIQEIQVNAEIDRARVSGTIDLSPTPEAVAFLESLQELNQDPISYFDSKDSKISKKKNDNPFSSYKSRLAFNGSVKVTPDMIFSICLHPNPTRCLSFVGDKKGVLSIWDITDSLEKSAVDQETEVVPIVHSFKPFKRSISKIMLPVKQNKAFLSSHDGSIREFDIVSQKFNEVFVHPDEDALGAIDFVHHENIWFSTHSGEVGLIDCRTSSKKAKFIFRASEKKINTIDFDRNTSKHHFVTAGLDHTVRIFDTRKLKEVDGLLEPVASYYHDKSVNAAYYDPTGSCIASLSFDDTIMLWNNITSASPSKSETRSSKSNHIAIRHNNNTGRWVQKFKPVWMPFPGSDGESVFAVGNMARKVDIFSRTGEVLAVLEDPQRLTAIPSVNAFHPNPACGMLISGNASGRMNVWM